MTPTHLQRELFKDALLYLLLLSEHHTCPHLRATCTPFRPRPPPARSLERTFARSLFFGGGVNFRFLLLFPHKQFQRRWVSVCVCVQPAVCDWLLPLTLLLWEALLLSAQTVQVPPAAETLGPPSCRCRSSCETRGEFVSVIMNKMNKSINELMSPLAGAQL